MASSFYTSALNAFLTGGINWTGDTLKLAFVGAGYTFSAADQFYSSVEANVIGTPQALSNTAVAAGDGTADNLVGPAIASGSTITQVVLYKDTGVAATSPLIGWWSLATAIPTNGGTVTAQWTNSQIVVAL